MFFYKEFQDSLNNVAVSNLLANVQCFLMIYIKRNWGVFMILRKYNKDLSQRKVEYLSLDLLNTGLSNTTIVIQKKAAAHNFKKKHVN